VSFSWTVLVAARQQCYINSTQANNNTSMVSWLVAWHSGGMLVFGQRTFPVLHSTCSWWVTIHVGKLSATSQPNRPTQPFILSGSIKWVVSCNQMSARVAPSAYGVNTWCGWMWQWCLLAASWFQVSI